MSYVLNTEQERREMLARIGVKEIEELFRDVPARQRFPRLNLPDKVSELEALQELRGLSELNADLDHYLCFLGAGAYRHYVPSVVDAIISRSEFYTAYTPYQPEISQGTLQAIFEYQTMICELTGMEVANASHYDGGTAMAEAAIMAINVARLKRKKIVVAPSVHPEYREVVRTYVQGMGLVITGDEDSRADLASLQGLLDDQTACLIVQAPDFFGRIPPLGLLKELAQAVHGVGGLLAVSVDPISLGLLRPPAEYGADIVLGEGQALGSGLNFGGPYLGFFATREEHVRKMAGRLVGQTVDTHGRRGFVLTLSTREQHIRREKATSNICTNEGLNALAAAVYLATLGKHGLRRVSELCYHRAHYAARRIAALPGFSLLDSHPFFKEFVVRCPRPAAEVNAELLEMGIIGGYEVGKVCPGLGDCLMFCVTEVNSRQEIDALVEALKEISG